MKTKNKNPRYAFPSSGEIKSLSKYILRRPVKNSVQLKKAALAWQIAAADNKLDWDVSWLGIPIIANPYDIVLMQELIFAVKPDLIIEAGIAHGGSLIYYASILELLGGGRVVGVDVDIRQHNRKLLEKHPFIKKIKMIEGSSTDPKIVEAIKREIKGAKRVLVCLDSNHNHDHVLKELQAYSKFVTKGSYVVVFDTFINNLPARYSYGRPWTNKLNPKTAVDEFLRTNKNFAIDKHYNKFFVSSCPDGFLKKIR